MFDKEEIKMDKNYVWVLVVRCKDSANVLVDDFVNVYTTRKAAREAKKNYILAHWTKGSKFVISKQFVRTSVFV